MIPSQWTVYVMMVHDVTGEMSRTILYHMSLARGYQYQVAWWRFRYTADRGIDCERAGLNQLASRMAV